MPIPQVTTVGMDKMAQIQMSNDAEDQFYKSCKLFLGEIKAQMRGGSYGRVRGEDLLACKSFTSKKTLIPKPMNRRQAPAEAMLYALHQPSKPPLGHLFPNKIIINSAPHSTTNTMSKSIIFFNKLRAMRHCSSIARPANTLRLGRVRRCGVGEGEFSCV